MYSSMNGGTVVDTVPTFAVAPGPVNAILVTRTCRRGSSVGAVRFELTTSRPPAGRANQAALRPVAPETLAAFRGSAGTARSPAGGSRGAPRTASGPAGSP